MKNRMIALVLALAMLVPMMLSATAVDNGTEPMQDEEDFDYSSLYVKDDLVISFSAYDIKDGKPESTTLKDSLGNSFKVGANATFEGGALLNKGQTVNLTDAQGNKLDHTSYTYEFIIGYEDTPCTAAGDFQDSVFTYGAVKTRVITTLNGITKHHQYATLGDGKGGALSNRWLCDFGMYSGSAGSLFDAEVGQIIEVTNTATKNDDKVIFDYYRNDIQIVYLPSNAAFREFLYHVPTQGFTLGKNLNLKIYAIRTYADALSEAEREQNHFVDIAAYHKLDLTGYLTLDSEARAKVHAGFSSIRLYDSDARELQEYLNGYVQMKGNFTVASLENCISFLGYAVRIYAGGDIGAFFALDKNAIRDVKFSGLTIESGTILLPADSEALENPLTFDKQTASFVASEDVYRHEVAYRSDRDEVAPESMVCKTGFYGTDSFTALLNQELVCKGYVAVTDGVNGYSVLIDAESELFGDSVTMLELYHYFIMNGYLAYPAVSGFCGEDFSAVLADSAVWDQLVKTNAALKAAEKEMADFISFGMLEKAAYAASQKAGANAYTAYCDAEIALAAYNAQLVIQGHYANTLAALTAEITALKNEISKVISKNGIESGAAIIEKLTADFESEAAALAEQSATMDVPQNLVDTYTSAASVLKAAIKVGKPAVQYLNGVRLSNYRIFGDMNEYAVKLLADSFLDIYDTVVPVLPECLAEYVGGQNTIVFDTVNPVDVYGRAILNGNGACITLRTNERNGMYHAVLKLLDVIDSKKQASLKGEVTVEASDVLNQTYAVDSLFNADGTFNSESEGTLTIVCIGGSLTELGSVWVNEFKAYFQKLFPKRQVEIINTGVGATGSEFGAARFEHQVLSKNPDLVFIEFAVNDSTNPEQESKRYMENMVYQCMQQEKIPGIIFGFTPVACEKGVSGKYENWRKQVEWKTEIAEHYGISTVNFYDYIYRSYLAEKEATGNYEMTYLDYIARYYNLTSGDSIIADKYGDAFYNVHPKAEGYMMYAKALIEAFDERLPSMLTRVKHEEFYCQGEESTIKTTYNFIAHNDERISYTDGWNVYDKSHPYNNADKNATINAEKAYGFPYHADGVHRTSKATGAAFTFKTTADALSFYCASARAAYTQIQVWVDGSMVGTFTGNMGAHQPAHSATVSLNNAGNKEVTVTVKMPDPTSSQYVFAFGYIIEHFIPAN